MSSGDDIMGEIELRKAQMDLGVTSFRVFMGARSEGASKSEAFLMSLAWFKAVVDAAHDDDDEEKKPDDDSG